MLLTFTVHRTGTGSFHTTELREEVGGDSDEEFDEDVDEYFADGGGGGGGASVGGTRGVWTPLRIPIEPEAKKGGVGAGFTAGFFSKPKKGAEDAGPTHGPALLIAVEDHELPSVEVVEEAEEADKYDRPFEPRLEDGDAEAAAAAADVTAKDEAALAEIEAALKAAEGATAAAPSLPPSPLTADAASAGAAASATAAAEEEEEEEWDPASGSPVPVGMDVALHGLSKASFNGLVGTVITTPNEEGRQGVRLESTGKSILVKSDKMKPHIRSKSMVCGLWSMVYGLWSVVCGSVVYDS